MANELYRGFEYRTFEVDGGFGWCVYGNSNLHPIQSSTAPERSRSMAEEAAMRFIDQTRKARASA